MVDPDSNQGGRNASPAEKFDWYVQEVSTLLHDLWGTEKVWDRFLELDRWYEENTSRGVIIERLDSSAPTLGSHPFSADWINDFTVGNADLEVQSQTLATQEIQTSFATARRVDAQEILSRCRLVLEPDATAMGVHAQHLAAAAKELGDLTRDLDTGDSRSSMPGFVTELQRNGWTEGSMSADAFYDFYGDLSDLTYRYGEAAAHLAATSAAAAALIARYQRSLSDIGLLARTEATEALEYWQANQAPSTSSLSRTAQDTLVTKVAGGAGLASDVLSFIPGADVVADPLGYVAQVVEWGSQTYDITIETTEARSADSIYGDLLAAVTKAQEEMMTALDVLRSRDVGASGSFQTFVEESQENGGWNPPKVST